MPTCIERTGKEIRFYPAGLYDFHADSKLLQLKGHAFTPAFECPLRRMVNRVKRDGHQSTDRRGVDKQSRSFLSEMRNKSLCCADRPQHVRVDHAEDLFIRKTFQRPSQTIAGIVEHHIDAVRGHNLFRDALDLLRISGVQCHQRYTMNYRQL